ncbi:hypothetical protein IFR05_004396, partial [Cadophora sp. M221]
PKWLASSAPIHFLRPATPVFARPPDKYVRGISPSTSPPSMLSATSIKEAVSRSPIRRTYYPDHLSTLPRQNSLLETVVPRNIVHLKLKTTAAKQPFGFYRRQIRHTKAAIMHHFKRVHGDYTLDDLLDPELTMHQYFHESFGSETAKEQQQSKRRRIVAASPESEETPPMKALQSRSDPPLHEEHSTEFDTAFTSVQDVEEVPTLAQTQGIQREISSQVRATLRTLELFISDDTGLFYWNAKKQMLVDARTRAVATTHKRDLGKLVSNIFFVMTLVASEVNSESLFKVVPREILKQVFGSKVDTELMESKLLGDWSKQRVKRKFIQENTAYAAQRLGSLNLWPPANASSELRADFVVNIAKIVSDPAGYLPRQWLWHVFQILLELRWKFNLIVGEAKNLRSAVSWVPHRIIPVPAQQQSGVARRCLARGTWDEIIDNFELDALETWETPPLDFMTIDCLPAFGGRQTSGKLSYVMLASFGTQLYQEESEVLPPRVAQHFQEHPPKSLPPSWGVDDLDANWIWASDEERYTEPTDLPGHGLGSIVERPQLLVRYYWQLKSHQTQIWIRYICDPYQKTRERRNLPNLQSHESPQNEQIGNEASYENTAPPSDGSEDRFIPGAWDNEWEPEERSFAKVSQAAYKWWTG